MLQSMCIRGSLTPPQAKNAFTVAAGVTSKISYLFSFSFGPTGMAGILQLNWLSPKGLQKYPSKSLQSCFFDDERCNNAYLFVCFGNHQQHFQHAAALWAKHSGSSIH